MRLATAEAAEQRACARLLAAEQRGHALGEQCRRLHARLGRTEVDLVGTCCRACCPSPTYQHPPSFLSCRGMALFCVTPVPGTLPFPETMQAQLRRQNESMLRDVSLKAGALREHQAKHDSSRVEIEQLQQQVRPQDLANAYSSLPELMLLSSMVTWSRPWIHHVHYHECMRVHELYFRCRTLSALVSQCPEAVLLQ